MSLDPAPDAVLGVLLARGCRADVFAWPGRSARVPGPLVVKVYRGPKATRRALALGVALGAVDHPHVVAVAGFVALGRRGIGVLLPRLGTTSARAWLAARRVVTAGEAVTLLVPLLLALLHLERRALDGRLRFRAEVDLDDVLFDESGAPVIVSAEVEAASGGASGAEGVARRLVGEVLRVTIGGRAGPRAILTALVSAPTTIDELLEVVFELDEPAPLEAADGASLGRDGARFGVETSGGRAQDHAPPRPGPEPPGGPEPSRSRSLAPVVAVPARVASLAGTLAAAVGRVRPRVWASVAILTVSVAVGLVVLGAPAAPDDHPGPSSSSAPAARQSAGVGPPALARDSASPPARADPDSAAEVLRGDDADGAARELLRLRAACLTALDPECLDGIDEPGSPALAADRAAVDDPALLADLPVTLRIDAVVNRLGGAVLYRARGPNDELASVLVTRTHDGWRVRTVAPAGSAGPGG